MYLELPVKAQKIVTYVNTLLFIFFPFLIFSVIAMGMMNWLTSLRLKEHK